MKAITTTATVRLLCAAPVLMLVACGTSLAEPTSCTHRFVWQATNHTDQAITVELWSAEGLDPGPTQRLQSLGTVAPSSTASVSFAENAFVVTRDLRIWSGRSRSYLVFQPGADGISAVEASYQWGCEGGAASISVPPQ